MVATHRRLTRVGRGTEPGLQAHSGIQILRRDTRSLYPNRSSQTHLLAPSSISLAPRTASQARFQILRRDTRSLYPNRSSQTHLLAPSFITLAPPPTQQVSSH